jgi:hypothetical protein
MKIDQIFGAAGDPGSFIRGELEQGLEPITKRVDSLEKKLDLLLLTLNRIEALLKALQPLTKMIGKIPFLK